MIMPFKNKPQNETYRLFWSKRYVNNVCVILLWENTRLASFLLLL